MKSKIVIPKSNSHIFSKKSKYSIKSLPFFLSSFLIVSLIIIAFSPTTFTRKDPNENYLPFMRPNSGWNEIKIQNTSEHVICIDSLFFVYKQGRDLLLKNIQISPHSTNASQFRLCEFIVKKNKDIHIELYGNSPSKKIIISFNQNPHKYVLKKSDRIYKGIIKKLNFIGKTKNFAQRFKEKSFLGTDDNGRDIWTRIIYGTRIVMKIIFFSLLISVPLGVIFGLIQGYYDNKFSKIIGVIAGLANSMSVYLLAMIIVSLKGQNLFYIVLAFSLVQWVEIQKLIYERVNVLRRNDFILSAKVFGKSNLNIIYSEILILIVPQILVGIIFLAKRIILIESSLSFLGYSVVEPFPSWGNIISASSSYIYTERGFWIVLPSALTILLTALSLNTIEKFLRKMI